MGLEQIVARMARIGTVTDVDTSKHRARVKFQDADMTSGWLYVLQHGGAGVTITPDAQHTHKITDSYTGGGSAEEFPAHDHPKSCLGYWMPKVNDTVLVLYLPISDSDGFILGGIA